jgi:hypothetical protein
MPRHVDQRSVLNLLGRLIVEVWEPERTIPDQMVWSNQKRRIPPLAELLDIMGGQPDVPDPNLSDVAGEVVSWG